MQLQIPMTAVEPWGNRAYSRRMRRYAQKYYFFFKVKAQPTRQEVPNKQAVHVTRAESSSRFDIFGGPSQTSGERKEKPSLGLFYTLRASFGFARSCQTQRMLWQNKKPQVSNMNDTQRDFRAGKTTYELADRCR